MRYQPPPAFARRVWICGMILLYLFSMQKAHAESAGSILAEAQSAYAMGDYKASLQSVNDIFTFSDPDELQKAEAWKIAALDYFYLGKRKMARYAFKRFRFFSPNFSFSSKKYPRNVIDFFSSKHSSAINQINQKQPLEKPFHKNYIRY